jgi:hypothetical protein
VLSVPLSARKPLHQPESPFSVEFIDQVVGSFSVRSRLSERFAQPRADVEATNVVIMLLYFPGFWQAFRPD